jgi:hypothetical protein
MHVKKIVGFGNHRIERGIAGLVRKSNLQHFTARLSFKHLDGMAQRIITHASSRCCERAAPPVKMTSASVARPGISFVLIGLHLCERGIGARPRRRTAGFSSALRRPHIDARQLPPRALLRCN